MASTCASGQDSERGGRPPLAHSQITEVFYIITGNGTLVTCGTLEDAKDIDRATPLIGSSSAGPKSTSARTTGLDLVPASGDVAALWRWGSPNRRLNARTFACCRSCSYLSIHRISRSHRRANGPRWLIALVFFYRDLRDRIAITVGFI